MEAARAASHLIGGAREETENPRQHKRVFRLVVGSVYMSMHLNIVHEGCR